MQGNAIQCSPRSNISHCFVSKLEVGKIFSIAKFSVVANKDKYQIRNGDAYLIPFELIPLEDIHANDSSYLIDVMGCAIDIGTIRTTKSGSELLECQLINERGTRVRVTMWGSLCNDFLKRTGHGNATYIVILPSMNIKEYRDEIYLSSTSATTLFDAIDISQIVELHSIFRANNTPSVHYMSPLPTSRTMLSVLNLSAPKTLGSIILAGITDVKRGLRALAQSFSVRLARRAVIFPKPDSTGSIVETLFDDVAEVLLNKKAASFLCAEEAADDSDAIPREILSLANTYHVFEIKTHTYFAHESYVSFTVNKLVESNGDTEDSPVGIKTLGMLWSDQLSVCVGGLDDGKNSTLAEDNLDGEKEGKDWPLTI
ncbi:hypothetical protein V2J09_000414 [Rumex salicifolius]